MMVNCPYISFSGSPCVSGANHTAPYHHLQNGANIAKDADREAADILESAADVLDDMEDGLAQQLRRQAEKLRNLS
jgi:hypothetical protein